MCSVQKPIENSGDQQVTFIGQLALNRKSKKTTSTEPAAFVVMNRNKACSSKNQLLQTGRWKIGARLLMRMEGSVFMGGDAIQWLSLMD